MKETAAIAREGLKGMRETGRDPAHGADAAMKRGATNRTHQLAVHEWNQTNDRQPESVFIEEILPRLQELPLSAIADATGLSKGYCSFIKRGIKSPHPRHWKQLRQLG